MTRRVFWLVVAFYFLVVGDSALVNAAGSPPLNPIRIAGELALGTAFAIGSTAVTQKLVSTGFCLGHCTESAADEARGLTVGVATAIPAAALGVYWIGTIGNETGSYWYALLGGTLAALPTYVIWVAGGDTLGERTTILGPISFLMGVAGAVVGFNLSRGYDSPGGTALLNLRDGKVSWGMPSIAFCHNRMRGVSTTVSLLDGRW